MVSGDREASPTTTPNADACPRESAWGFLRGSRPNRSRRLSAYVRSKLGRASANQSRLTLSDSSPMTSPHSRTRQVFSMRRSSSNGLPPSTATLPADGARREAITDRRVDLPAPLRPRRPWMRSGARSIVTSLRAAVRPYETPRPEVLTL